MLLDPSNVGSESKTRIYLVLMIIGSVVRAQHLVTNAKPLVPGLINRGILQMWLTSVISLGVDEGDKIKPKRPTEVKLVSPEHSISF